VALCSLKNQKEFDLVNKHGLKSYGSCFLLVVSKQCRFLPHFTDTSFFLGMKVSRKLSKKAVIRNKIKRRIRHLATNLLNTYSQKTNGVGIIVVPREGFELANFAHLQSDFTKAFFKNIQ
jgi:ribonuclease P protein component